MNEAGRVNPFTFRVRLSLVPVSVLLLAAGIASVYLTENGAGAAALITVGTGVGVLALIGPHVDAFQFGGLEARFRKTAAADALQDAIEEAAKSAGVKVSVGDKSGALRRAEAHISLLRKAAILWVDDVPGNVDTERRMLNALGVSVDIALTNVEAMRKLTRGSYVCVISDIDRPEGEESGLELASRMQDSAPHWLIYYVGHLDPHKGTPPYALGITNRPDQLLHYVLDSIEREGFEPAQA